MSKTLSNGYIQPDVGDFGTTFFPDIIKNTKRTNDHTHNGIDSEKLNTTNLDKITQSISKDNWVAGTPEEISEYSQTITMPTGLTFDNVQMKFTVSTTGHTDLGFVIHPEIKKTGESEYTITVNDNTIDLQVLYV